MGTHALRTRASTSSNTRLLTAAAAAGSEPAFHVLRILASRRRRRRRRVQLRGHLLKISAEAAGEEEREEGDGRAGQI